MAMFCPVCRVEYRDGFTRCSDCDVALVDHLPAAAAERDRDAPTDAEGRELLWSGLSARLYETIRDALDAAHISHNDVEKEFGVLPTFQQAAQLIWVDPGDLDAAQSILESVLARPETAGQHEGEADSYTGRMNLFGTRRRDYNAPPRADNAPAPADDQDWQDSGADSGPAPNDLPEDFHPDDATAEVWSGEDPETAEFLKASLSGVGIGCIVSEDGGKSRVLVLPADEARAQVIVREVVEGAPPQ